MKTKYLALDVHGWPLQFTGKGKSVQVSVEDADEFETEQAAQDALTRAGEKQGWPCPYECEHDNGASNPGAERKI